MNCSATSGASLIETASPLSSVIETSITSLTNVGCDAPVDKDIASLNTL